MSRQKKNYSHHWWADFELNYDPETRSRFGRVGGNASNAELAEKARKSETGRFLKNGHQILKSGIGEGPYPD